MRALGTPDSGPGLRQGLEALEHSSVAVRSMFGTLETVARATAADGRGDRRRGARGVRPSCCTSSPTALRAFGRLVREEARPADRAGDVEPVRGRLDGLHEARARIAELLLSTRDDDPAAGRARRVAGATVERLLRELDLEERGRRLPAAARRPRITLPRVGTVRRR